MRFLFKTLAKLVLIVLVALGFYTIYLDSTLTKRFAAERYEASAIVYARPLTLEPIKPLRPAQLIAELQQLRYRESASLSSSGTYRQVGQSIEIHRRPFDFPSGPAMAQRARVYFADGYVTNIESLPEGRMLGQFQIDPLVLGQITGADGEDRMLVGLERLPNLLIETLLLVEDRDFYHHAGVSLTSIGRAAMANLVAMDTVQGGSTLTQQLVKNLYLTRDQTLWRKANEALMALIIDFRFSKNEILESYFNEIYFGQDGGRAIHGIGLASRYYFGKQVEELTAADIALLVGIIKGPSYYNPHRYPERVQARRDMILQLMYAQDLISQPTYLAALEQQLVAPKDAQAGRTWAPHYLERVKTELGQLQIPKDWSKHGLRVFTYLNPIAQQAAERSINEQLARLSKDEQLQAATVIADHQRASIISMVGDRDRNQVGFNRATAALRQVGSLIKPTIYAMALEQPAKYRLGTLLQDEPLEWQQADGDIWRPENYDKEFVGPIMLYDALAQSRNLPAVRLGMDVGLPAVVERLRSSGIETPIQAVPALSLGAVELSPLQVTELFGVMAAQGQFRPFATIQAITDHEGLELYQRQVPQGRQVYDRATSGLVNYGLRGVVNEGTGKQLARLFGQNALAGKSGTTNDNRDSWFVAYDQQRLVTTWVGRDDNQPIGLTGATGALPIVAAIYSQIGVQPLHTNLAPGLEMTAFHPETGEPIPLDCPQQRRFPAFPVNLPENTNCAGEQEEKSWWQKLF